MEAPYQTYLQNLAQARGLLKPHFDPALSEDVIIASIRESAERLFQLHRENDAILQEILFSKTAQTLTAPEADALFQLASALFNYNRSPDVGIAYRIHQLLYAYSQHHNDVDGMVRELYYQGITLLYLNVKNADAHIHLFAERIRTYFETGAGYLSQYESLTNPETRGYIIRCLGNIKYGLPLGPGGNPQWSAYSEIFRCTMSIVESPRYRAMNPEIPWDNFCYTMHYDRTQFLTFLRGRHDPAMAAAVLESAEYVYRHQEQIAAAGEKAVGIRTQYVYAAARFHAGLIDAQELMDVLFRICEHADANDFSSDAIWAILTCPEYMSHYAQYLPAQRQEALRPQIERIMKHRMEYLFRLPNNEYSSQVSQALSVVIEHAANMDRRFSDQILNYILACHPPTYVHSVVVAMLTRWFCARFAKAAPELLDGLFDLKDPAKDPRTLARLLERAYRVGLYHDTGKCMLLSYVGQYNRRLLDEEFACIKLHPDFGCTLLNSLALQDLACAAKFHHRSYDRNAGYPQSAQECPPSLRLIVDIVTVVDSLDAGTDNVGRSYASAKSFARLVEELRAGKGVRYAPDVVALLDDAQFYQDTERFLQICRRRAYVSAYCVKA